MRALPSRLPCSGIDIAIVADNGKIFFLFPSALARAASHAGHLPLSARAAPGPRRSRPGRVCHARAARQARQPASAAPSAPGASCHGCGQPLRVCPPQRASRALRRRGGLSRNNRKRAPRPRQPRLQAGRALRGPGAKALDSLVSAASVRAGRAEGNARALRYN